VREFELYMKRPPIGEELRADEPHQHREYNAGLNVDRIHLGTRPFSRY